MVASNSIVTDLFNLRDLLQNIKNRFLNIRYNSKKYEGDNKEEYEGDNNQTKQLDNEQLEKLLLKMESESKTNIKHEDSSKQENSSLDVKVEREECKEDQQIKVKLEVNDDQSNEVSKIQPMNIDQSDKASKIESIKTDQSDKTSKIEPMKTGQLDKTSKVEPMETDQSENLADNLNQPGLRSNNDKQCVNQLNESENINDQSEADTETADEEAVCDVEKDVYFTEQRDITSFCKIGKLPKLSIEGLTPNEIISRFELLLEVERIESEVENKVEELNGYLDVLENEYENIDRSKNAMRDFKKKFKLPDTRSLTDFLHRIKWTSIIKESAFLTE